MGTYLKNLLIESDYYLILFYWLDFFGFPLSRDA